ncbi:MAG: hypothetical protein ACK559_37010, partial [bacterium]
MQVQRGAGDERPEAGQVVGRLPRTGHRDHAPAGRARVALRVVGLAEGALKEGGDEADHPVEGGLGHRVPAAEADRGGPDHLRGAHEVGHDAVRGVAHAALA